VIFANHRVAMYYNVGFPYPEWKNRDGDTLAETPRTDMLFAQKFRAQSKAKHGLSQY